MKFIDVNSYPARSVLDILLQDKLTKKNIIWATDTYEELGHGFTDKEQVDRDHLLLHTDVIKPRIQKSQEAQAARTRKKAEVFTPARLCNQMNNYCDQEWFDRKDVYYGAVPVTSERIWALGVSTRQRFLRKNRSSWKECIRES